MKRLAAPQKQEHPYLRKIPRQARSQIQFRRILDTARQLFEEKGYAYVSTNQIAEAANISIGSIYQYFPNCEAIALALYEAASTKAMRLATRKAFEPGLPFDQAVPAILGALVDIFEQDRYVLLHLLDEVPELRQATKVMSFDNLIQRATQTYLEQRFPGTDELALRRKSHMIVTCIVATTRNFLDERPADLDKKELVDELGAMVQLYLHATLGQCERVVLTGSEDQPVQQQDAQPNLA